jgi:hypothetical protein
MCRVGESRVLRRIRLAVGHAVRPVLASRRAHVLSALWSLHRLDRDGRALLGYHLAMNDCCSCERGTRAPAAQRRRVLLASLGKGTVTEVPPPLS